MALLSWQWDATGAARTWMVAILFCLTGLVCGLVLPFAFGSSEAPGSLRAEGTVARIEQIRDMQQPIFRFTDNKGEKREFPSGLLSNRTAYHEGEKVTVVFVPGGPTAPFVENDRDVGVVLLILRVLGLMFGGLGLTILIMKLRKVDDLKISRIGGVIGALVYAIPATFVLPGLLAAYQFRPNVLFSADSDFGRISWLIGTIFSGTGVFVLVGAILMYRYQERTGREGWSWHGESGQNGDNP